MGQDSKIGSQVRYEITRWPEDAPRGAVTEFCARHGISRQSFYEIRKRAAQEGAVAAWEPRSRRPVNSPSRTAQEVVDNALVVRAELEAAGLDFGPISVGDAMTALGLATPSRATLARIFLAAGVVDPQPRKRPRAALRRFVYPAPNCLWQLDGFTYPLAGGRYGTILQVIDDHSRKILASLAARSENSTDVLAVVRTAIHQHGVPQRFLSDNGVALNPTRRKVRGQLVDYLQGLGVITMTGRPGRPTTQGKSERHHRTTAQWLNKQPLAHGLNELQRLLEDFENVYNHSRRHQALPGRTTPQQAWDATDTASPPPLPTRTHTEPPTRHAAQGTATRTVSASGSITLHGTDYQLGHAHRGQTIHITYDPHTVEFFTHTGDSIRTVARPTPGTRYVGNSQPPNTTTTQPAAAKP